MAIGRTVVRSTATVGRTAFYLSDGQVVRTRTIVIATGVKYRKLDLPSLARFEGAGVFYSATYLEGQLCQGEEIAIVGGGNSAGQAAVFLAGVATRVHMLVRGPGLAESMSRYLIQRIENTPNVVLRTRTQIEALEGDNGLERVRWRHLDTGERETREIRSCVPDDRRGSQHRLARGVRAPRRQEVREDRRRSAPRGSRRAPTGRCPAGPTSWRPASPACSASATRARPASSAWPPPSARDRSASSSSTGRCRRCERRRYERCKRISIVPIEISVSQPGLTIGQAYTFMVTDLSGEIPSGERSRLVR